MITTLARFVVPEERMEQALADVRQMAAEMEANEPGALAYIAHRCLANPNELIILELYESEAAYEEHHRSRHMEALQAALGDIIDSASYKIERLERAAGYIRPSAG
jgi:quinol monooxygenase YgiN